MPRASSLSVLSFSSGTSSSLGSFVSKKLSFRSSAQLQDAVSLARDPAASPEEKYRAIRTIRNDADKCESMALIRLGVVDIMLDVMRSPASDDQKMWALYVILRLVKEPETAVWMLEKPTVDALEVLSTVLITKLKNRGGHQGTLIVQRILAIFSTMCKEDMTLALLARSEVFAALEAALTYGMPDEVSAALFSYDLLIKTVDPSFLLAVAGACPAALRTIVDAHYKVSAEDKARARQCIEQFDAAAALPQALSEAPEIKMAREKMSKWSKFMLETFEGQGPIATRLLQEALANRDSTSHGP